MKKFDVATKNEYGQIAFVTVNAKTAEEAKEIVLTQGFDLYYPDSLPKENFN